MLNELGVANKIFYDSIPMLMRLLPLRKKPKRWHNNLQFRIRNKLTHYSKDKHLLKELQQYDAIVLSECYPNAFWKNYLAIEEFKKIYEGALISYTDGPLDAAPLHKIKHLDKDDYDESVYDFNLFVTDTLEIKTRVHDKQAVAGICIAQNAALRPQQKKEFIAVVDFAQPGYEAYREQQIRVLRKTGIKTIVLDGTYPIQTIREIYREAAIFFLSFPETFGLPIAECLACGTYVCTPDSAWPMAWRLDAAPLSWAPGVLPDCFRVYQNETELENMLLGLRAEYDLVKTPLAVFNRFKEYYPRFYNGDEQALKNMLEQLN